MLNSLDNTPLERAIKAAGSARELARRVGVSPQSVWLWRKGKSISAERALDIESATNGVVSKHDLRPDLWGPREAAQ